MKKSSARKHSPAKRKRKKRRKQWKISAWAAVGITLLTFLIVLSPPIFSGRNTGKGAKVPSGTFCYGIDISSYQDAIKWDSLRVMTDASGRTTLSKTHAKDIKPLSFVFIKATEGAAMKDKKFKRHWNDAHKNGIRRGAYHFFRSSKDPEQQARLFIKTVGKLDADDLPPVLDIETIHKGCSITVLNYKALKWLKAVESHYGRKPIVYSSSYFMNEILSEDITDNYPIWVAHYERDRPSCRNWNFWQFTDNGVIYGIDGAVDISVTTSEMLKNL